MAGGVDLNFGPRRGLVWLLFDVDEFSRLTPPGHALVQALEVARSGLATSELG